MFLLQVVSLQAASRFKFNSFYDSTEDLRSTNTGQKGLSMHQKQTNDFSSFCSSYNFIKMERYELVDASIELNCTILISFKTKEEYEIAMAEFVNIAKFINQISFDGIKPYKFFLGANLALKYIKRHTPYITTFQNHKKNNTCDKKNFKYLDTKYLCYFFIDRDKKIVVLVCDIYDFFGANSSFFFAPKFFREADCFIMYGRTVPEKIEENRYVFDQIVALSSISRYNLKYIQFFKSNESGAADLEMVCGFEMSGGFFDCAFFKKQETIVYFIFEKLND